MLEDLAAFAFYQDTDGARHAPACGPQDLHAVHARHQERDAAVAGHADTLGKLREGFEFEAGDVDALELLGGVHGRQLLAFGKKHFKILNRKGAKESPRSQRNEIFNPSKLVSRRAKVTN